MLRDGLDLGHFSQAEFDEARALLERATGAVTRLTVAIEKKAGKGKKEG